MKKNSAVEMWRWKKGISAAIVAAGVGAVAHAEASGDVGLKQPALAAEVATDAQSDGKSWRRKGDGFLQAGQPEKALEAYRKAEALGAGDEALTMDIAQIYRQLGREREAYWEYHKNQYASDPAIRESACYGMNDLQWAKYKTLKAPYFADLGVYGGWQSIKDASYLAAKARVGIVQGDTHPLSYYLFARAVGDDRSGNVGGMLQTLSDNVAIVGAGVQKLLVPNIGLKAVAEVGAARDLVYQDRDRNRTDVRAGIEQWYEWYAGRKCGSTNRFPNRFVLTTWGELMYYSRYNDAVIFSADVRPGLRVYETDKSAVDALGIFVVSFDSKADKAFQYGEAGVGVRWIPDLHSTFRVTAKAVQTFDSNGTAGHKNALEFEYYAYW